MTLSDLDDNQIRAELHLIDEDGSIEVSSWEAGFIESLTQKYKVGKLSQKQRFHAEEIIKKYGK